MRVSCYFPKLSQISFLISRFSNYYLYMEGSTENDMVGWHHRINSHNFAQTLGDSEGQGSLA